MATTEIRTLDPDDLDQLADLRALAFGGPRQELTTENTPVAPLHVVAAYDGSKLLGTVARHDFDEWFGGRQVRCAGIAGVIISPDHRGQGLARRLLDETMHRAHDDAQPISALFPTTASLYRSVGYEVAGWWTETDIAVGELPRPGGDVAWEPSTTAAPEVIDVYERCAANRDGWIVPGPRWWTATALRQAAEATPNWCWLGRRDGEPVAALGYRHATSERALFDLQAWMVTGVDGAALAEALAMAGAHGTTAGAVTTTLPSHVLATALAQPSRPKVVRDWPWMLRLVDLPGAVAARGWPAGVSGRIDIDVAPAPVAAGPAVSGRWRVELTGGHASCEPGGDATLHLGAGDLAALYAGWADPAHLAFAGRLRGGNDDDRSLLRAAFAGTPSQPIFF